jgi:uncharacterized protein YndB with AHSA1/START domain
MDSGAFAVIRIARHFDAAAERVFDAWLDPRIAGRWLFATPTGEMVRVEIDARVGGRFLFIERRDGEDMAHVGEYLTIDRPKRLVFTFAVPRLSPLYTRVSIDIFAARSGCELTLLHEGVLAEYATRVQSGWGEILNGLAMSLAATEHAARLQS